MLPALYPAGVMRDPGDIFSGNVAVNHQKKQEDEANE
jgi:hypothetical protein